MKEKSPALLGAHVSIAGGVAKAPARGKEIGATAIQIFTKTPNQWAEPRLGQDEIERFKAEIKTNGIEAVVSHDSYLINLASPKKSLRNRSKASFKKELERCRDLSIGYVVTHPGNFMDERSDGLARNAEAYTECLESVDGPMILIETTAGTGTSLGSNFEELADLRQRIPKALRSRVGFCADTCHIFAAGYDIKSDWEGVWQSWEKIIGFEHLRCVHVNDSKTPFGSRKDRHEWISEGSLGKGPFRDLMQDSRFQGIIKVLETPKGDDPVKNDRRMLRRLRAYARGS